MSAPGGATFDDFLEEQLRDPQFQAAFEDAEARQRLIDCLVHIRRDSKVTQRALATAMGVGQSTVSGFETEGADPRLSTLQRYARAVGGQLRIRVDVPKSAPWRTPVYGAGEAPSPTVVASNVVHLRIADRWKSPAWKGA